MHWTTTNGLAVPFGERRAPAPDGRPGFIRIDSVHQGDQDGVKGLYHINAVDCVTQFELVATCERLSEAYLMPVLAVLLDGFPFAILGFHADNGSEFIHHTVAKLLERLRVEEFTNSRPRHCNDNGLAETKNGAVVRKHLGYSHIPQRFARRSMPSAKHSSTPTSTSTARASSPRCSSTRRAKPASAIPSET